MKSTAHHATPGIPHARRLVTDASRLLAHRGPAPALAHLHEAMAEIPANQKVARSIVHQKLGDIYLSNEDYEPSKHHLEQSLELSPSNAYARWSLSQWHIDQGNIKSAWNILDETRSNPDLCSFYMQPENLNQQTLIARAWGKVLRHVGFWLEAQGEPEQATVYYLDAIDLGTRAIEQGNPNSFNFVERALAALLVKNFDMAAYDIASCKQECPPLITEACHIARSDGHQALVQHIQAYRL